MPCRGLLNRSETITEMGLSNLLEYAVAMPSLAAATDTTGHFTATFLRKLAADDAIYRLESSTDLINWQSGSSVFERIDQSDPADGMVHETWRLLAPVIPQQPRYLRLRIEVRP